MVFYNDTRVILDKIDHNFSCEVEDSLCCDNNHLFDIDIYYNEIVLALTQAANFNIPKVPKNAMKHYWSITLDELKGNSLSRYRICWLLEMQYVLMRVDSVMTCLITCFQKICRVFGKSGLTKRVRVLFQLIRLMGKTDDLEIANAFRESLNVCSNRKDSIDFDFIQDCDG